MKVHKCTGPGTQKGLAPGLRLYRRHLEILKNCEENVLHIHFSLHLANYIAGFTRVTSLDPDVCERGVSNLVFLKEGRELG